MDVKTAFLNGFVEEEIYMDQSEGFTVVGEEHKVCHLQRSIYGLKQASRSWNIHFDEVIRGYNFVKNNLTLVYTRRYQACAREAHWSAVKIILKYLRRIKDVFLVYGGGELILEGFSNANFQSDDDDAKSLSGFVFKLNGGVVAWKSSKQDHN
ncbi:UNVERIFIED_CONTAM: Secreted RxLR effector protein [Sesamum angustifolium]|uniref:Secreted RxLR effector protein n=1 Tax=Sesamum angustifolium TaxID=2727405 RepID=A0AAW2MLP9_9LAMI